MRKILLERGFQMKQAVDKMSEYLCDIRDWCNYTVVPIIHTNRDITSIDNIRFAKDELYPTSEHLKDTGNIAEDCDYLFTIFNPRNIQHTTICINLLMCARVLECRRPMLLAAQYYDPNLFQK